ncbi:MAG: ABC transporter permease [Anaerolineae bacterium]|nr:ABC transporter permease [Anaerolineae bacterium]MDW8172174.1 ABC transporter permease subunit [Anaerolineae bacterium]
MQGELFTETLRRSWRTALYWGLALGFISLFTVAFVQDMDALKQYQELFKTMPAGLLAALGMDISREMTPESFINLAVFAQLVMIMPIYGIVAGLSLTSNDEDEGIMDMVLTAPVARWRVIVERFAAFCVFIVLIALLNHLGVWLGGTFLTSLPLDMNKLAVASLSLIPLMIFTAALTALIATLVKRRTVAIGLAVLIVIISYFLDTLGAAATDSIVGALRPLSYFRYYDSANIMFEGVQPLNLLILLGGAALMIAAAVYRWERRDVGL